MASIPGRGPSTTPYTNTGTPGQWQGGRWVPATGEANDADQLNYLRGESSSATNQGKGFSASYTDSQGRVHSIGNNPTNPLKQQQDQFENQMSQFQRFTGTFGNLGGGGNGSGSLTGSGTLTHGTAPRVALDTAAIDAGDRAAFSRAKDRIGASTAGLMKSIQNQFGGRGLRGSSIEGRAISSGLNAQEGNLADTSREQAIEGSRRATDLAKTQYSGDIEQRGQDIGAETANRQFAAQQQQSKLASILGLWNAFNGMRY